jgi:hypothetical protein
VRTTAKITVVTPDDILDELPVFRFPIHFSWAFDDVIRKGVEIGTPHLSIEHPGDDETEAPGHEPSWQLFTFLLDLADIAESLEEMTPPEDPFVPLGGYQLLPRKEEPSSARSRTGESIWTPTDDWTAGRRRARCADLRAADPARDASRRAHQARRSGASARGIDRVRGRRRERARVAGR